MDIPLETRPFIQTFISTIQVLYATTAAVLDDS